MASTDISLFAYEAAEQKKEKSPTALRTISEASEILDVPQHVLRFWETKFSQVKPLKRNGGRRFYRPQDIDVLQQIKHLLYNQGYTIKGAKKAVDDFISARSERPVNAEDWIATIPPASVNDNFVAPLVSLVEATPESVLAAEASHEADLLAELATALTEEPAEEGIALPQRHQLEDLRSELLAMREALLLRLPAASPVYQ